MGPPLEPKATKATPGYLLAPSSRALHGNDQGSYREAAALPVIRAAFCINAVSFTQDCLAWALQVPLSCFIEPIPWLVFIQAHAPALVN